MNETLPNQDEKPAKVCKGIDKRRKAIDLKEVFDLHFKHGLNPRQIARQLSAPVSTIYKAVKDFTSIMKNSAAAMSYEVNKSSILNVIEYELVKDLMSKSKRSKASLNNIAYTVKQINEINRLEKGQPTSIDLTINADIVEMMALLRPKGITDEKSVVIDI